MRHFLRIAREGTVDVRLVRQLRIVEDDGLLSGVHINGVNEATCSSQPTAREVRTFGLAGSAGPGDAVGGRCVEGAVEEEGCGGAGTAGT